MNKKTEAKYSWLLLSGAATALSRGLFWSVTFLTGLIAEREGCGLEEGVVGWTAHGLKTWRPEERAEDSISSQRSLGSSLILGVHWWTAWKCLELAPMLWRKKIMPFIPENQGGQLWGGFSERRFWDKENCDWSLLVFKKFSGILFWIWDAASLGKSAKSPIKLKSQMLRFILRGEKPVHQGWAGIPVSRDSREYKPQISLPVAFCNFPSRSREKDVLAGKNYHYLQFCGWLVKAWK